ncbi:hypothetical protein PGB90_002531 [Kerria lacca]
MSQNFHYEKNSNQRECQNKTDTKCDVFGNQQVYQNVEASKGVEAEQHVKFITNKSDINNNGSVICFQKKPSRRCISGILYSTSVQDDRVGGQSIKSPRKRPSREEVAAKCSKPKPPKRVVSCKVKEPYWQHGKYVQDDCGSGIIPLRLTFNSSRPKWCKTPLTSYQAIHGELGRKILCGEEEITRTINPGPPCNLCEIVMPLCRGYYRKYDCDVSPCEKDLLYRTRRSKLLNKVERYWEPCMTIKERLDVNRFAPQNMALALKFMKKSNSKDCW